MIARKTVLILGAGASVPYGLPTGYQWSDIIRMTHIIDGIPGTSMSKPLSNQFLRTVQSPS
jgi:hypothetical protein